VGDLALPPGNRNEVRALFSQARVGILAQRFGGEIGKHTDDKKGSGKGLLKIATGGAADCHESTLER
jgi:hypothetical protein